VRAGTRRFGSGLLGVADRLKGWASFGGSTPRRTRRPHRISWVAKASMGLERVGALPTYLKISETVRGGLHQGMGGTWVKTGIHDIFYFIFLILLDDYFKAADVFRTLSEEVKYLSTKKKEKKKKKPLDGQGVAGFYFLKKTLIQLFRTYCPSVPWGPDIWPPVVGLCFRAFVKLVKRQGNKRPCPRGSGLELKRQGWEVACCALRHPAPSFSELYIGQQRRGRGDVKTSRVADKLSENQKAAILALWPAGHSSAIRPSSSAGRRHLMWDLNERHSFQQLLGLFSSKCLPKGVAGSTRHHSPM